MSESKLLIISDDESTSYMPKDLDSGQSTNATDIMGL